MAHSWLVICNSKDSQCSLKPSPLCHAIDCLRCTTPDTNWCFSLLHSSFKCVLVLFLYLLQQSIVCFRKIIANYPVSDSTFLSIVSQLGWMPTNFTNLSCIHISSLTPFTYVLMQCFTMKFHVIFIAVLHCTYIRHTLFMINYSGVTAVILSGSMDFAICKPWRVLYFLD